MLLLKIGGAIFAPKDRENFVNTNYLQGLYEFLYREISSPQIILHGTGNIGHGFVKKNGLSLDNQHILRNDLDMFFDQIDNIFQGYNRLDAELILDDSYDEDQQEYTLSGGDIDGEANIISSDDLFGYYLNKYKPRTSFLLTDVDGVYDADKKIISHIDAQNLASLNFWAKDGDVTGSMQNKIYKLFSYHKNPGKEKLTIWIANGHDLGNFQDILNTGKGIGTKVIV